MLPIKNAISSAFVCVRKKAGWQEKQRVEQRRAAALHEDISSGRFGQIQPRKSIGAAGCRREPCAANAYEILKESGWESASGSKATSVRAGAAKDTGGKWEKKFGGF
jgi:hypothetical protein